MWVVQGAVRLRPVRRTWDRNREVRGEVELTADALTAFFGMREAEAARSFGVGLTKFKVVCRRLGIERWPYSRRGRLRGRTGSAPVVRSGEISSTGTESAEEESDLWFLANTRGAEEGSDLCFIACD